MKTKTGIVKDNGSASGFIRAQLETAKYITGDDHSYVMKENPIDVVPIPSISLQWLLNSNGWPLGMATSCTGAAKTFKSSFSAQLASWFMSRGGISSIIDTEYMQAERAMNRVFEVVEDIEKYVEASQYQISLASTPDEWEKLLVEFATLREKWFKTGDRMPLCALSVIDSVPMDDDAIAARLCALSDQLVGWPVCMHTVREQPDRKGRLSGEEGMAAVGFSSLDLLFSVGGTSAYNSACSKKPKFGREGHIIGIEVRHSAIGPEGKEQRIDVPVLYKGVINKDSKSKERKVYFDWGAADAHCLRSKAMQIKDTMDINAVCVKGMGDCYWSEALGVPETHPVMASSFGLKVQSNDKIMRGLRNDLYIAENKVLAPV